MNLGIKGVSNVLDVGKSTNKLSTVGALNDNKGFADALKTALNNVNSIQKEADIKTEMLAQGQINDLHDVMITAQKASITLETAVQIQQKVIDVYSEMMRMQV